MQTSPASYTGHSLQRMQKRNIGTHGIQAAMLYGERFVLDDGTLVHLITRKTADRLVQITGASSGQVENALRGLYVVLSRDGAIITCGRRWSGKQGRLRRS